MKILAISDNVLPQLEDALNLQRNYSEAEAVISCGDMPAHYLEYVASTLNVPLFFVRGNHDIYYTETRPGGINLHRRMFTFQGLTMAGLEGCIRYNNAPIQYTESEMFLKVIGLAPLMLLQRLRRGRGIDIMVTHSPPRDIHDQTDRAHRGFRSFRLLMRLYRPRYLIHGHVDTHDSRRTWSTTFAGTEVININPAKLLAFEPIERKPRRGLREPNRR